MGYDLERQDLVRWREIVYCLRRQVMSHNMRRAQMVILNLMIERGRQRYDNSDFNNTCLAIQGILRHITTDESLTHAGVKSGLSLIETVCQQRIQDWFVPDPSDEPGDLPF